MSENHPVDEFKTTKTSVPMSEVFEMQMSGPGKAKLAANPELAKAAARMAFLDKLCERGVVSREDGGRFVWGCPRAEMSETPAQLEELPVDQPLIIERKASDV